MPPSPPAWCHSWSAGPRPIAAPALALNAAGQSLGAFLGAATGAAGLWLAGYPGAAAVFGATTAVGLLFAVRVR